MFRSRIRIISILGNSNRRKSTSIINDFSICFSKNNQILSTTLSEYKKIKNSNNFINNVIYKVKIDKDDSKNLINAFVLPPSIKSWPTFNTVKQDKANCQNICLVRTQNPTKQLYIKTIEYLRNNFNVAWIGNH